MQSQYNIYTFCANILENKGKQFIDTPTLNHEKKFVIYHNLF